MAPRGMAHMTPAQRVDALSERLAPRGAAFAPASDRIALTDEERRAQRRASRKRYRLLVSLAPRLCDAMNRGLSVREAAREVGCSPADAEAALDLPAKLIRSPK